MLATGPEIVLLRVAMLSRGPFSLVLGSRFGTVGGGAAALGLVAAVAVVAVVVVAVVAAAGTGTGAGTGTAAAGTLADTHMCTSKLTNK